MPKGGLVQTVLQQQLKFFPGKKIPNFLKTADQPWPLIYLADLQYGKLPAAGEQHHAAAKAEGKEAAVRNDLQFVFNSCFFVSALA